jgi:hypothetical protein
LFFCPSSCSPVYPHSLPDFFLHPLFCSPVYPRDLFSLSLSLSLSLIFLCRSRFFFSLRSWE